MSNSVRISLLGSCLVMLLGIRCGHTADLGDLAVHGFITQGYVKTSSNRFFGDSDKGSFDFREIGINATLEPAPSVRLSGQLLSRKAGEMSDGNIDVDFALADITAYSGERGGIGILLGRVKNPLGLFNETRDVAFTRPGLFVPQIIYYDKVRNLVLSADGLAVHADAFGNVANISFYFAAGQPQVDENAEHGFLGAGFVGDLEPDGFAYLGRVLLESPSGVVRTSFSLSHIKMKFDRGISDPVGDGAIDSFFGVASVQLTGERWRFSAEFMQEPTKWRGFAGSVFDGMNASAEGYFAQFAWQTRGNIEFLVRYGEGFADRADRSGQQFNRRTLGFVPAHSRYSKIFTAGVRWDVTRNIMLRAEYQRHNGTFILSSRENPAVGNLVPDWDLLAFEASYRF